MENNLLALHIIVNAGYADEVIEIARENGARGATILNARGSAPKHQVFMGITIDTEKEIVLCLTTRETCDKVMLAVKENAGAGTNAHAVCFSLPVDKTLGINLTDGTDSD